MSTLHVIPPNRHPAPLRRHHHHGRLNSWASVPTSCQSPEPPTIPLPFSVAQCTLPKVECAWARARTHTRAHTSPTPLWQSLGFLFETASSKAPLEIALGSLLVETDVPPLRPSHRLLTLAFSLPLPLSGFPGSSAAKLPELERAIILQNS